MARTRPLRVLHVLGQMNPGGVESWLLNVFRTADRRSVRFDVMVHQAAEGAYDAELRELGIGIHHNTGFRSLPRYYRRFREIAVAARYDVVHSHVHHYSAIVLACAAALGIPARIAHSHSDTRLADRQSGVARRLYLAAMRQLLRISATKAIACSGMAASALFGQRSRTACELLYCGIDSAPFSRAPEHDQVRDEFQLPAAAELVIHVGRIDYPKNHALLIDAFQILARRRPLAYLMLVGSGTLEASMRDRVRDLGIEDRVRFCGRRSDVARLLGAADVFAFPSHHEGLPLSCLEAQAAGLPVVMSDRISPEVVVLPEQVTVLPIDAAEAWAAGIDSALRHGADRVRGLEAIRGSAFEIRRSTASLLALYAAQTNTTVLVP